MTDIFLGMPPPNVAEWIISHSQPSEHPETRFTLQNGTVETYDITGTLDTQWMINNGYYVPYDPDTGEGDYWVKIIIQADIGNTVTSIGDETFSSCIELTSVTIPNSVTSIGWLVFFDCTNLMSVTIGSGVTSIGNQAFENCNSLTSILIPNNVTVINYDTFSGCSSLTSVTIPNRVTNIAEGAFSYCREMTSVTIPDSVTSIGVNAFMDCDSLTSVMIVANDGNANNVKQMMITAGVPENITWNMPV